MSVESDFKYMAEVLRQSSVAIKSGQDAVRMFHILTGTKAEGAFLSETLGDDGQRHFYSLWLANSSYLVEFEHFPRLDQVDCAPLRESVSYWKFSMKEYDLERATATSRLSFQIVFPDNNGARCQASGENCDKLRDFYRAFVLPNFK